jgi:hypothetical protein
MVLMIAMMKLAMPEIMASRPLPIAEKMDPCRKGKAFHQQQSTAKKNKITMIVYI